MGIIKKVVGKTIGAFGDVAAVVKKNKRRQIRQPRKWS